MAARATRGPQLVQDMELYRYEYHRPAVWHRAPGSHADHCALLHERAGLSSAPGGLCTTPSRTGEFCHFVACWKGEEQGHSHSDVPGRDGIASDWPWPVGASQVFRLL